MNKPEIESLIQQFDFTDYKWITANDIKISQWVRMKCLFTCGDRGRPVCPPNVPSIEECRTFIHEYKEILMFHLQKKVDFHHYPSAWAKALNTNLFKLEREIFLAGHPKTFLLPASSCKLCKQCVSEKEKCKQPGQSRPAPEAMGIDVFSTARRLNWPIEVLKESSTEMNRYAFLLVE